MAYSYTGRRLIADILEDITGLTEWVDYFPVQYDETTDTATKGGALIITDEGGPGDNHPVYLVTGRTLPFRCNSNGYVPIIDAPVIPAGYPSLLSSVSTYDGVSSITVASHDVALPAHSIGDLLIVTISHASSVKPWPLAGWAKYEGTAIWSGVTARITSVYWKIALSDSGATTVTITNGSAARAQARSFVIDAGTFDPTVPVEVTPVASYASSGSSGSTTLVPASVTPSWGSAEALWLPFTFNQIVALDDYQTISGEASDLVIPATAGAPHLGVNSYSKGEVSASLSPATFSAFTVSDTPRSTIWAGATIAVQPSDGTPFTPIPDIEVTTTAPTGTSTTQAVNYPAVVDAGDLLAMLVGVSNTRTVTTPSGWTPRGSIIQGNSKIYAYSKIAAGTEGGTTFNLSLSGGGQRIECIVRIPAAEFDNSGTYIDSLSGNGANGTSVGTAVCAPSWGSGSRTLFLSAALCYSTSDTYYITCPYHNHQTVHRTTVTGSGVPLIALDHTIKTTTSEGSVTFAHEANSGTVLNWASAVIPIKLV